MVLEEHGDYRSFAAGEVIFRAGDETRQMYVVDSGRVEIVSESDGHEMQLSVLGPEEIFGEMALFGGGPRSATARAMVNSGVRVIREEDILKLVPNPLARQLLVAMSRRLRDVDEKLALLSSEADVSRDQVLEVRDALSRHG